EPTHRSAFAEAAKRREQAYDAWEAAGHPETGPEASARDAAIAQIAQVRAAATSELGAERADELFAEADDASGQDIVSPETGSDAPPTDLSDTDVSQAGPVAQAATDANPEPTDGQKEAGNYKLGHARWNGLDLSIENQKGSTRSGTD